MRKTDKISVIIFLFSIVISSYSFADEIDDEILIANQKVKSIEDWIADNKYPVIRIKNIIEAFEGIPPEIIFHYNLSTYKLVSVTVLAGHETWGKSFFYFFDQDENIIKYSEVISERPDNPPDAVILYKSDGSILWSNKKKAIIAPEDIMDFYNKLMVLETGFSTY